MAKKTRFAVEVWIQHTTTPNDSTAMLIEWLCYAGLVKVNAFQNGTVTNNWSLFQMFAPAHVGDTKAWADSNAQRINSFAAMGCGAKVIELD